ncbi:P-loop containing nucleoside triphosphate hydrolase protein [Flagelloscypha sp. PMI_526]|nr:P-loop containing nucleoside triphosphate hydrolase protein [Flagelloscypha sp. PMI_526]
MVSSESTSSSAVFKILGTVFPGIILLSTLVHDIWSASHIPSDLRSFVLGFSTPFTNFLGHADLTDPLGARMTPKLGKVRLLVGISSLQAAASLSAFMFAVVNNDKPSLYQFLLAFVAWVYIAIRTCSIPLTVPFFSFFIAATYLTRQLSAENIAENNSIPSSKLSCPEDKTTLWEWCSFSFVKPLFQITSKRTLNDVDVWTLSPYFKHKNLFEKYLRHIMEYPKLTIFWFLVSSNSLDLILDLTLELWKSFVGFVPPYALQEILANLPADSESYDSPEVLEKRKIVYYWTLVILACHLSFAQFDLFKGWHTRRCYERTRGQLFCMLHYKALRRRDISGKTTTSGEKKEDNSDLGRIVNLMQGDAYAVAQRFWEFSALFSAPIRIVIALVFLYNILGWSALAGVAVFIVTSLLNWPLAQYNIHITRESWKSKDKRMGLVNELLQNIRFLKYYGWEYHWARSTQASRDSELNWRVKENVVDTAIAFIWTWVPSATALASFLCFTVIAKETLTVSKAFTAIAGPLTTFPMQIFAILHAYVSMQRIEGFLGEEEVPDWASTLSAIPQPKIERLGFIGGARFEWNSVKSSDHPTFQLGPLDFEFPLGAVSLVTGPTGSGKTALLSALLGEMACLSGNVQIDKTSHKVAYCGQSPWLEHATIRDNIIYASQQGYDEKRYQLVLEACALKPDLSILQDGDMTEIGEKGITLSGGQRARVALARALYSTAQVILLDDPLAAVDMHTAQHLVQKALSGPLAEGRTFILVTHHITLCLPITSHLLELSRGKILHSGSIEGLRAQGILEEVIEVEEEPFPEDEALVDETVPNENEADALEKLNIEEPKTAPTKLIEEEFRAEGKVSWRTYLAYVRAAGYLCWTMTIILMLAIRCINIGNQIFLARWGEAYEKGASSITAFIAPFDFQISLAYPWSNFPPPSEQPLPWLMVYLWISVAGAVTVLLYIALGYYASLQASRQLFSSLLQRLTRAPSRFFDTTPIGRILNRFVSDINTIDNALQNSARACLSGIMDFVASFLVILFIVPAFAPLALFIAWLYIRLAPSYVQTSRDLRRLESISLSPAFAGFDELLRGIVTVRAFGAEDRYQNQFYGKVDKFQSFDHVYWLTNSWLRWHYDCLGSLVVFASTIFAIWADIPNGSAAVVIVQAGIFAEASRQLVKVAAQLELDFNSVERVVEYLGIPQEAPAKVASNPVPAQWPSQDGDIIFKNLEVRYSVDLPPVLKKLNFVVRPREKIGVCGRTGRTIIIDGIDIRTIGLEDLRSRVTIVSQDVSLFEGTVRSNLDPLEEHSEEECLEVIERCHLRKILGHKDGISALNMPINGGSLSAGERQLVSIARAVLRGSHRASIIIMDEATSQIDSKLDDQVQSTLRENLPDSIVLTIAHRLKTIIDYDRVLVLSDGDIVEFDTPQTLLAKPGGVFREMCKKSADWTILKRGIQHTRTDSSSLI